MSAQPEAAAAPAGGWQRVPADDALAIGTVLVRCARLMDSGAWPELAQVYTADAVGTTPSGTARGLAELVEHARADDRRPHHVTDTVLHRVGPDRVRAWSKWLVVGADGSVSGGDQLDLLVRTPDGWRIGQRRVTRSDPRQQDAPARVRVADFLA